MTGTTLAIDSTVGNPSPGSVKLTIPFDGLSESLIFQQLTNMDNNSLGDNLGGTTLSAQLKLDSTGASIDSSFNAYFALKATAGYVYAVGPTVTLQEGSWVTLTMSADMANQVPMFDTCHVFEIDIIINSGTTGTYMGNTVMHLDTITISGGGDGGAPSDGGSTTDGGGSDSSAADGGADSAAADGGSDSAADVSSQ